jgi:hypothetical protein
MASNFGYYEAWHPISTISWDEELNTDYDFPLTTTGKSTVLEVESGERPWAIDHMQGSFP